MNLNQQTERVRDFLEEFNGVCVHCQTPLAFKGIIELKNQENELVKLVQTQCVSCGHVVFFDYATIFGSLGL